MINFCVLAITLAHTVRGQGFVGWQQQMNNAGGAQVILEVFSPVLQAAMNGSRDSVSAMSEAITFWTPNGANIPNNVSLESGIQ